MKPRSTKNSNKQGDHFQHMGGFVTSSETRTATPSKGRLRPLLRAPRSDCSGDVTVGTFVHSLDVL